MSSVEVCVYKLGILEYMKALNIQSKIASSVKNGLFPCKGGAVMVLEHPPVYTVGLRKGSYTEKDESRLRSLGADYVRTDRGGLITFHGPGQLVVWPVLHLKQFKTSIRWYVDNLEEIIINLCQHYNISAHRSPHTGVWVNDEKICAIGVHASRFVTSHGLALNCNTDLSWFEHIVPCGIPDKGVTSLSAQLNRNVVISEVIPKFLECFKTNFNCRLVQSSNVDLDKVYNESSA